MFPTDDPQQSADEPQTDENDAVDAAENTEADASGAAHDNEGNRTRSVADDVKATARKVWLAGLGALSVAEAEGTKVFNKLVEQGEQFEDRSKPKVEELKARAARTREKTSDKIRSLEKRVETAVSSRLQGAGMAAQAQVDDLQARIAELEAALTRVIGQESEAKDEAAPSGAAEDAAAEGAGADGQGADSQDANSQDANGQDAAADESK